MLVTFESSTDGHLQMFSDVAAPILGFLGKPPAPRGVMAKEELPRLLAELKRMRDGASGTETLPGDAHAAADLEAHELPVSLRQRLTPLIDLMQRTIDNDGYVLWTAPGELGGPVR